MYGTVVLGTRLLSALLVTAFVAASATPLMAQSASDYSEQTLTAFASARVAVNRIAEEYSPRIQGAESKEQAQKLQREANVQMVQAVEAAGLEVPRYNEISRAMRQDDQLRARVSQLMEEVQG